MLARRLLLAAGLLSFSVAALHIVIIFLGAAAYRWFGAPGSIVQMAERGSLQPALVTAALAAVFCVFGAYALSAACVIRELPLLLPGLIVICAIYLLRGLLVFAELAALHERGMSLLHRVVMFSSASLIIGIVYAAGIALLIARGGPAAQFTPS
jgi:putative oxidoreductase